MKGLLLHIAADTTTLGVVGPVFEDFSFEYLPVNNLYGIENRTYQDVAARNRKYGQTLADFLPSDLAELPVHFDPDFSNCIYGQDLSRHPRAYTLRKLEEFDILFFVASLAPYDQGIYEHKDVLLRRYQYGKRNKYVIGYFTVKGVSEVRVFKSTPNLTIPLLCIRTLEVEGETPIDLGQVKDGLEWLLEQGFIMKEGDTYRLSREHEVLHEQRSGEEIVQCIDDLWPDDEDSQRRLLETGKFDIQILSGNITEESAKCCHHYKRLRPLDLDYFIVIKGDPDQSALLTHAIQLTDGFERFGYKLNELGQFILGKATDSLRGTRWIDQNAIRQLAKKIAESNPEIGNKLQHMM